MQLRCRCRFLRPRTLRAVRARRQEGAGPAERVRRQRHSRLDEAAQHPPGDGRPVGAALHRRLRTSAGAYAGHGRPGRAGCSLRRRLLPVSVVRSLAVRDAGWPTRVGHRGLGQRHRAAGVGADPRPLPPAGRLPHHALGEDALRRTGPAARIRAPPDHRHLPGGLRLDTRMGILRRPDRQVVPRHGQPVGGGPGGGDLPDRLRRGGGVRRRQAPIRHGPRPRRPALLPGRLLHPSPRSLRGPSRVVGSLRPRRHRPARRSTPGVARSPHPPHPPGHPGRERRLRRGRTPQREARLLRQHELLRLVAGRPPEEQ